MSQDGQFLATIRNANEVFMNLIGSPSTYIANRRAIVLWKHRIIFFSPFDVIITIRKVYLVASIMVNLQLQL